jgi:hypothetical protein
VVIILTLATIVALLPDDAILLVDAQPPQPGASGINDSCQRCHVGESGTTVGATLTIDGVPEQYVPGKLYTFVVRLDPGAGPPFQQAIRYGFQLAVTGGTLQVSAVGTVAVNETEVGSIGAVEDTEWSMVWRAPPTDEDVAIFAEAVVGDGDGTDEGDITLEARAFSYGPLRVPPESNIDFWPGRALVLTASVATVAILGYLIVFTHRRPPPTVVDD